MANNKEQFIREIKHFIESDEKCVLVTGTHQYEKHIGVMALLNKYMLHSMVLFRSNAMQNLTERSFLGEFLNKKPKMGEKFRIENNIYEADSFNNKGSWGKTSEKFDAAILYPIDAIARKDVSTECIDNLFECKCIKKIFLISWTDCSYDFSTFDKYVDKRVVYDAEEEDIEYHKRVLESGKKF